MIKAYSDGEFERLIEINPHFSTRIKDGKMEWDCFNLLTTVHLGIILRKQMLTYLEEIGNLKSEVVEFIENMRIETHKFTLDSTEMEFMDVDQKSIDIRRMELDDCLSSYQDKINKNHKLIIDYTDRFNQIRDFLPSISYCGVIS